MDKEKRLSAAALDEKNARIECGRNRGRLISICIKNLLYATFFVILQRIFKCKSVMRKSLLSLAALISSMVSLADIQLDSVLIENPKSQEKNVYVLDYGSDYNTIVITNKYYDSSVWINNHKCVFKQDAHTIDICNYNLYDNQWVESRHHIYEYDDYGNMISKTVFPDNQRFTTEYNNAGNVIKSADYKLENGTWIITSYIEYLYNESALLMETKHKVSYGINNKSEIRYSNDTIVYTSFLWDGSNSTWNESWQTKEYYMNEQLLYQASLSYNGQIWVSNLQRIWEYDSNGNIIEYREEHQSNNEWYTYNKVKYTYQYNLLSNNVAGVHPFVDYVINDGVWIGECNNNNAPLSELSYDSENNIIGSKTYFYNVSTDLRNINLQNVLVVGKRIIYNDDIKIFNMAGQDVTHINGYLDAGVYVVLSGNRSVKVIIK